MDVIARPLGTSAGYWLTDRFSEQEWTSFRCAAAFLSRGGADYLAPMLHDFTRRSGTAARVSVGVDAQGTSLEGVQKVWRVLTGGYGEFWIVHEGGSGRGVFHPKIFLFENAQSARLVVGSANLTVGGLYQNHEPPRRVRRLGSLIPQLAAGAAV